MVLIEEFPGRVRCLVASSVFWEAVPSSPGSEASERLGTREKPWSAGTRERHRLGLDALSGLGGYGGKEPDWMRVAEIPSPWKAEISQYDELTTLEFFFMLPGGTNQASVSLCICSKTH